MNKLFQNLETQCACRPCRTMQVSNFVLFSLPLHPPNLAPRTFFPPPPSQGKGPRLPSPPWSAEEFTWQVGTSCMLTAYQIIRSRAFDVKQDGGVFSLIIERFYFTSGVFVHGLNLFSSCFYMVQKQVSIFISIL